MNGNVWYESPDGTLELALLSHQHMDETIELVEKSFINCENISVTFGIQNDPLAKQDVKNLCKEAIQDGISMIAIDKTEKSDGKVVAFAINKIQENKPGQSFFERHAALCKSQNSRDFIQFMIDIDSKCNMFETLKTDCIAEIMFLGVDPEYRQHHIAYLLGIATFECIFFRYCGMNIPKRLDGKPIPFESIPTAMSCIFSSKYIQKLYKHMPAGATIAINIPYKDLYRNGKCYKETINTAVHDSVGVIYLDLTKMTEEYFVYLSKVGLAKPEYIECAKKLYFGK